MLPSLCSQEASCCHRPATGNPPSTYAPKSAPKPGVKQLGISNLFIGGMHGCLKSLVIMLLVYLSKLMAGRLFTLREDMPTKHTFVQFRDVSVRAC